MNRQVKLSAYKLLASALAIAGLAWATTAATGQEQKAKKSNIDLVICLDTSGSMSGLIESAKVKLWDIVNELAKAEPAPRLRIALFTYGSPQYGKESGWVKKNLGFTTDLDTVYQKLFALRTRGGSEYVARVSKAALDDLQWSMAKNTLRLIFVCGNEPATQDPKFKLENVAQEAVKRDIFINTIHCRYSGSNQAEIQSWQKLAALAEGRFVSIDQNKGAVAINTPVDKKLAELGAQLNKTYVWYGKLGQARAQNQEAQDKNAAKLGVGVAAARAEAKSNTALYNQATACLVDRLLTEKNFDVTKVKGKDLPEYLRKMKPKERVEYVNKKKEERLALQKQIAELSKQRQQFLDEYIKKNQGSAEKAFDQALRSCLQEQAKKKGIIISGK